MTDSLFEMTPCIHEASNIAYGLYELRSKIMGEYTFCSAWQNDDWRFALGPCSAPDTASGPHFPFATRQPATANPAYYFANHCARSQGRSDWQTACIVPGVDTYLHMRDCFPGFLLLRCPSCSL
jgi:hypothetical protein